MGSMGSGRRHWFSKKATVEECRVLDINKMVKGDLFHRPFAEVRWSREGKEIASISYSVKERVLTLYGTVVQNIPLVTTRLHSGGERYWFLCPNCRRRVGRLYLPPGKSWFFCRRDWDLTYTSCQQSHAFDSLFEKMGVPLWLGRALLKRSWREMVPSQAYGGDG